MSRRKYCNEECARKAYSLANKEKWIRFNPLKPQRKRKRGERVISENMIKLFAMLNRLPIPKNKMPNIKMEKLRQAYKHITKMKLIVI